MQIDEHVLLAPYTTFGIGGLARYFVRVTSIEELKKSLDFARDQHQPVLMLGGGSNILVSDAGWDGLVIKVELRGLEFEDEGHDANKKILIARGGESWDKIVEQVVEQNCWGLENLSGIPGTVGGAVVQNIGAYGAALSQTLLWVEVLDTTLGEIKKMSNAECAFGYRESFFKHDKGQHVVLRAAFTLSHTPKPNVLYKDLAARFAEAQPDITAIRAAVLDIRKAKFPDLTVEGTAGSFFKNPIVPLAEAEVLKAHYPDMPLFDMPETTGVKVPLAWLLDHALNLKGATVGGARLYEKQPLVIVAKKNTPASDVYTLAQKIKKEVQEKLHIEIEEEVRVL
ncbi:MAG TPA: UDP-N-acetylmuramate dehydrogenase [Candidatus Paceibacterota bacterium]|jgi:UDP-N-acetylmuramate dehydrogenase|nr:UDP-N-acetylmuramate dehydrogenase [Candidatus Paceibacterota bacterium]